MRPRQHVAAQAVVAWLCATSPAHALQPLARRHRLARCCPDVDTTRTQPCDKADAEFLFGCFSRDETDQHVLVELCAIAPCRAQILTIAMLVENHLAAQRCFLDVNIEDI